MSRRSEKTIKLNLLNSWTPELAWFLGLMYGDGNVYRTKRNSRLTFVCNVDTVNKWKALICPDAGHQVKSEDCWSGYVDSKDLVDWFAERGIVGEKSTNLAWPEYLPREFYKEFLRGLFDTDGSVTIDENAKQGFPPLIVGFSGKNKSFVERVRAEILAAVDVDPVAITLNRKKNKEGKVSIWHSFRHSSGPAIKVCDYLYEDAHEHLRGESRYQTYRSYVERQAARICQACGDKAWSEDFCQPCWWKNWREENPVQVCVCGRPVVAKGVCLPCYKRQKRQADPAYGKKSTGTCSCGKPSYRKGMCDACYSRERRASR